MVAGGTAAGIGEVRILLPKKGMCPICWGRHKKGTEHDTSSLYYINHFYREHWTFPAKEEIANH